MTPIKKAIRTITFLTQRLSQLNFNSKAEIIEAYEMEQQIERIERTNRNKRFQELADIFEFKECCPFDDVTVKYTEQEKLLWRLVDLESSQHE